MQPHPIHPKYNKIKAWAWEQDFITHTMLQIKFNLRYQDSRKIIHALQAECVILSDSNLKGEYRISYFTQTQQTQG